MLWSWLGGARRRNDMPEHHAHDSHHAKYGAVFAALCIFTFISILTDFVGLRYGVKIVAVLAVATCKALCVMAWFMHLKFERAWKYVLLAPTIILAIGLPLALMPDVGVHYYTQEVPQLDDYAEHLARSAKHADGAEPSEHKGSGGH
jgi:caa(3)-type oxidase subunit IV